MATLKIAEFTDVAMSMPTVAFAPPIAQQVITFTTTTPSAAFNARTNMIRLISDTICSIAFAAVGQTTTATTAATAIKLNAQVPEYFHVLPGASLAVVTDS